MHADEFVHRVAEREQAGRDGTVQHVRAVLATLKAEALAVADEISVADTLVRLARERDAAAVVVGAHGYSRVRELLLGSTSREVIRHATCPVVVVRECKDDDG